MLRIHSETVCFLLSAADSIAFNSSGVTRNFAAHDGPQAKKAAVEATELERMSDSGSWAKRQNRLEIKFLTKPAALAQEINDAAPY